MTEQKTTEPEGGAVAIPDTEAETPELAGGGDAAAPLPDVRSDPVDEEAERPIEDEEEA